MLEIIKYPDPILLKKAEKVGEITPKITALVTYMHETMDFHNGLGLAAPQIGESKRIIVFRNEYGQLTSLINPVITYMEGTVSQLESCLSVPGFSGVVVRHEVIKVTGGDIYGFVRDYDSVTGMTSRILQHEIDHLDGTLFVERLNRHGRRAFQKHCKQRGY